jgi:F0F1-type ATP synthase membrane subunit c/vacuolar-type H+-ATPase subunit K
MELESMTLLSNAIKYIAVALCMIPMFGVATGIGNIFSSLIAEISRNPAAKSTLFTYALIGFALVEAAGLYALVIAFIIMFA